MNRQHLASPQLTAHWRVALWCACGLMTGQVLSAPAELGTLMFSPQQREEIVRARHGQAGLLQELSLKRLNGVVKRSNGKNTVWVNDSAMSESNPNAPRIVGLDAIVKDKRLRVGESVDAITGDASDLVPPGSVRLGPSGGRK